MSIDLTFTNRRGESFHARVDECDHDLVAFTWHVAKRTNTAYLERSNRNNKHTESIHRVILGRMLGRELARYEQVDHIDLNGLNNTRQNLRLATHGQNLANARVQRNNKLGIKGVSKSGSRFVTAIKVGGERHHLGYFPTAELAHAAYVEAAKKYFGDFARGE